MATTVQCQRCFADFISKSRHYVDEDDKYDEDSEDDEDNEDSDNEDTGLTQAEPEALLPEHGDKRAFKHATLYNNERFTTNGLRNLSLYR